MDLIPPRPAGSLSLRCVARTQSIEEAKRIADSFELQGYLVKIKEQKQGPLSLYSVWVGKMEGRNLPLQ